MTDIWPPSKRSLVMGRIRSRRNRSTEMELVLLFRKSGITGWRRHLPLPGRPDFCLPCRKVAVFVDGYFWHGSRRCSLRPASNKEFWRKKLEANRARDRRVSRELVARGYFVIRVKEHELRNPGAVIAKTKRAIQPN